MSDIVGPITVPDEAPKFFAENIRLSRENHALRARVKELEEALQRIVDLPYNGHGYSLVIARAALEDRT